MASTWVQALSSPALSAAIGALAGLGGGWLAASAQRKDRREAERNRRREAAAAAVGPVLALIFEGDLDRAGPGPGDLSGRLGAWEAAWSRYREPLLIMTAGNPSQDVYNYGRYAAHDVLSWLDAVRRYVIEAQQLSEQRRRDTQQAVLEATSDPDEAVIESTKASDIDLRDPELNDRRREVQQAWKDAEERLRDLLVSLRQNA
jgi:hypothetical protein